MMKSHVNVATRVHDYGEIETSKVKYVPETTNPLPIKRPSTKSIPQISKGSAKHSTINPNARVAQNYLIVEYLAQIPCAMSVLEVLQSCLAQRSDLLSTISAVDPKNSLALTFDTLNVKKRLPHHMAFQIKSTYRKTNIIRIVIDEGASTCVMYMSCWKAIGSPSTVPSPTLFTTFDGHSHRPHGIIPTFPICVGGKVVNIEVEINDANLDYNLLLGRNWIYEMNAIVSYLFRILCFPREGRILKIDQLDYSPGDSHTTSDSTIPLVDNPRQPIENLGVGM